MPDMMEYIYTIPGTPVAQGRHRHFLRNNFVQTYDPMKKEKDLARKSLIAQKRTEIGLGCDIAVSLRFGYGFSETLSNVARNAKKWYPQKTTKPDIDNLIKFILDVGNGILWPDDNMISRISASKFFTEKPFTEITILIKKDLELPEETRKMQKILTPDDVIQIVCDMRRMIVHYNSAILPSLDGSPSYKQIREDRWQTFEELADTFLPLLLEFTQKYQPLFSKINKCKTATYREGKTLS